VKAFAYPVMLDTGKPYILLVDDTEANLRVLGPLLRAEGWAVAAATRGQQALDIIAQRRPDLVLLDVMMPEMDGFEVCRRLRADPGLRDLPVLFITALTEEDDIVRGFREGGQDYIVKPFRQAELVARVRTHLALRQATRRAEKQAADLAQLNADKDRFFSIIAHDLRSPLAGLLGLSETLAANLSAFTPEEVGEAADEMAKCSRNLFQLLENLLEWSQLQTGRMECRPDRVELTAVLKELAELFGPAVQQKDLKLKLDLKRVTAWVDHRMLQTIIRNLISNAIKFIPVGGTITLRCGLRDGWAMAEFHDTGLGIPSDQLVNLFGGSATPASRSGTAGERGTGLGLVLCRELLDRSHGSISAISTPGLGSTFTILVPLPAEA
jgi:two-component system, sensor histidine kinase and response regulator